MRLLRRADKWGIRRCKYVMRFCDTMCFCNVFTVLQNGAALPEEYTVCAVWLTNTVSGLNNRNVVNG